MWTHSLVSFWVSSLFWLTSNATRTKLGQGSPHTIVSCTVSAAVPEVLQYRKCCSPIHQWSHVDRRMSTLHAKEILGKNGLSESSDMREESAEHMPWAGCSPWAGPAHACSLGLRTVHMPWMSVLPEFLVPQAAQRMRRSLGCMRARHQAVARRSLDGRWRRSRGPSAAAAPRRDRDRGPSTRSMRRRR